MIGLFVELSIECPGCGKPLPLNALAKHFVCGHCSRGVNVDKGRWRRLLAEVLREGPRFPLKQGKSLIVDSGGGTSFRLMYGRLDPRCENCKSEIVVAEAVAAAAQADGKVKCKGCDRVMSLRRPQGMGSAVPGVAYVFGEDLGQLPGAHPGAAPYRAGPIVFHCPKCGASLPVDGSARTVPCEYCRAEAYLPDDLWFRFHPVVATKRWFLLSDTEADRQAGILPIAWSCLADAAIDRDGLLYACGDPNRAGFSVWAMAPDLKPRWVQRDVELDFDDKPHLRWSPDGTLLLWAERKHAVRRLSCSTGATLTTLGGQEPPGASAHHLDVFGCQDLAVDRDRTIVAALLDRILRWSPDGRPTTTWPPPTGFFAHKEDLRPLYSEGGKAQKVEDVQTLADRPLFARSEDLRVAVGWDGLLCLSYRHGLPTVAKFYPTGKRVMSVSFEARTDYSAHGKAAPGVDAQGNIYLVVQTVSHARELWRISADGHQVLPIVCPLAEAETRLLVAPNGTSWLLGDNGHARKVDANGKVLFESLASREDHHRADEADG